MKVFDNTPCDLGEGPLWHPLTKQFFWFDINAKKLFCKHPQHALRTWQFDEYVSAAAWIDEEHLLIASEQSLFKFNTSDASQQIICKLDADNPLTRSNDGRADPWGGFWIGTMDKQAQHHGGAIYRYYRGELRQLKSNITISNAICFAPDKSCAYYTDTSERIIYQQPLAKDSGWPVGEQQLFIDFRPQQLNPDGAVCDAQGNLWIAQWGSAQLTQYSSEGKFIQSIKAPSEQVTCPAFGGDQFDTLYVTSALQGLSTSLPEHAKAGQTYHFALRSHHSTSKIRGLPEYQVVV